MALNNNYNFDKLDLVEGKKVIRMSLIKETIWIVYRAQSRWSKDSVQGFGTEKEALDSLVGSPKSRIVGIFKGERLEPEMGEKRVVRKSVVGFTEYKESNLDF